MNKILFCLTAAVAASALFAADVNRKRGYGWSRVHINNIEVTDSIIRYGVTNRNGATGYWNGTWFSATDFKLKKAE